MDFIKGEDREQLRLPDTMDEYIEKDNPVRFIDCYIEKLDIQKMGFKRVEPERTGRPAYSTKDMLKLYVYANMNRIRSSRRIEAETHRNVEMMWLMKGLKPDYKTISQFRKGNGTALKKVFLDFVKICVKLDLFGRELVAIDGSKFKAMNSKERNFNEKKIQERLNRISEKITEYMAELDRNDLREEGIENKQSIDELKKKIEELTKRAEEYMEMSEGLKASGETQVSLTDPDSRRMIMSNGASDICFNIQMAVDSKEKLVAEFEVTNDGYDFGNLQPMGEAAKEALEVDKISVLADRGFNSPTDMAECIKNNITPHVAMDGDDITVCIATECEYPKPEKQENGKCIYDEKHNVVICPMGEILFPDRYRPERQIMVYKNKMACANCQHKCTISKQKEMEVKIKPDKATKQYSTENLQVRQIQIRPDKELIKIRKTISEHPIGILKRCMDFGYCLTRGKESVRGEYALGFLVLNMKRVINIVGVQKLMEVIG